MRKEDDRFSYAPYAAIVHGQGDGSARFLERVLEEYAYVIETSKRTTE